MPTIGALVSPVMAPDDPATVCCGPGCHDRVSKTLYLSNDFGFFTAHYDPANPGTWKVSFSASVDTCSDFQPDPAHTPTIFTPGPCRKPKDDDATDDLTITAVISCPDGTGRWRVQYFAPAETTYRRWNGANLANANDCGGFNTEVARSLTVHADAAGCPPAQTFAAPAAAWTGASGHSYPTPPAVGPSVLSS